MRRLGDIMNFITTPYRVSDLEILSKAGAGSVIVSNPFFSVRGAAYEPVEVLPVYKKECDRLGLKLYVQVNRFFMEEDLKVLKEHLLYLKDIDIDGIYFGDEGVLQYAKELKMEDKLIYQPDTLITNAFDVQFYLKEGIQRVVLAKEITLDEVLTICDQCERDKLEIVLHGRLNMMHSKRDLLTNYLTFVSKPMDIKNNHDLYIMEETRDEHMPILEDEQGTHVFSGFTLASFKEIKAFKQHGMKHVRIEGIFQTVDKVEEILKDYQSVLNDEVNGADMMKKYQEEKTEDHYTSGFYYTKTSKIK